EGLRDGLSDANVPFRSTMIADLRNFDPFADSSEIVAEAVATVMARSPRPTAIYCACDALARLVYRQLSRMNLRVGTDVSVVGNDDDPAVQWLSPGMTTVQQSFTEMGHAAMELLRRRIADPSAACDVLVHPVKLILRDSVAACPGT
ncbi:MAG TPA: substrate-binding domain-containing protein, partial [Roseimicrobium sp.]|nr:substrate-binding domain-containing protein [Roseimicrobium sp.]